MPIQHPIYNTPTYGPKKIFDPILNRIFVGAGGGYGIINNPNGPLAQLRFGGYPVVNVAKDRARRKALMLGVDARMYFVSVGPVVQVMAAVGYEAY